MSENRYCLQMVSCGDGCGGTSGSGTGAENVYSTDETVCGTWIDGKPIYRKVIVGKLAEANGNGITFARVPELNIERVISLKGHFLDTRSVSQSIPLIGNTTVGLSALVNMNYGGQTKELVYHFLNNGGTYSGCTAYVVLEYTKETDSNP